MSSFVEEDNMVRSLAFLPAYETTPCYGHLISAHQLDEKSFGIDPNWEKYSPIKL
jgi:hypothetical protein